MKLSRRLIPFALSLLGALAFAAGCSDRNNVSGPQQPNFETAQFAIIDYTDVINGIEDATIDAPMSINSVMQNYSIMGGDTPFNPGNPGFRGMRWYERFNFNKQLGLLFRQLNLTDDQKTAIRDCAKTFHQNMKPLVTQFYQANQTTIENANATRKAIVDSVKAGTLTRANAATEITALNQATRDQINANPASQTIKASMCAERETLFGGINAILVGDQITKWENWIANIQNPCAS